jgi:hypothetical protein
MLALTTAQVLGLSVVAALVTTIGSLLATFLKDYVFVRSSEKWKERQTLQSVHRRYRDPLRLTAEELRSRLALICAEYPPAFLSADVLEDQSPILMDNLVTDPYFEKYRFISTAYRLCAFLGWIELYRQELTFLYSGLKGDDQRLDEAIKGFQGDLADGHLNDAKDFTAWVDRLIFREEQRAIGARMIRGDDHRVVLGYENFREDFERTDDDGGLWWLRTIRRFLMVDAAQLQGLEPVNDFRLERYKRMVAHLERCISVLSPLPRRRILRKAGDANRA